VPCPTRNHPETPRLLDDLFERGPNPLFNVSLLESIQWIAGDDAFSTMRSLRVEACRPITAADDEAIEIIFGEVEHTAVFIERSPPRHYLIQREHR
jgi:hypothetical protein